MSPLPITGLAVPSALTDAYALTGKLPLRLDETVVPVAVVGDHSDDIYGPAAVGQINMPGGGVGFRSMVELSLPVVGSAQGAAIKAESLIIQAIAAAQIYEIGASPGLPAHTHNGTTAWRDTGRAGQPAAIITGRNNVGVIAMVVVLRVRLQVNETLIVPLDWILRENAITGVQQGLMIRTSTDQEQMSMSLTWRERVAR